MLIWKQKAQKWLLDVWKDMVVVGSREQLVST